MLSRRLLGGGGGFCGFLAASGFLGEPFLGELGALFQGEPKGLAELGHTDDLSDELFLGGELALGRSHRGGRLRLVGRGGGGSAARRASGLGLGAGGFVGPLLHDVLERRVAFGEVEAGINAQASLFALGKLDGGGIGLRERKTEALADVRAAPLHASLDVGCEGGGFELVSRPELDVGRLKRGLDDEAALVLIVAVFGLVGLNLVDERLELAAHGELGIQVVMGGGRQLRRGSDDGRGESGDVAHGGSGRGGAHMSDVYCGFCEIRSRRCVEGLIANRVKILRWVGAIVKRLFSSLKGKAIWNVANGPARRFRWWGVSYASRECVSYIHARACYMYAHLSIRARVLYLPAPAHPTHTRPPCPRAPGRERLSARPRAEKYKAPNRLTFSARRPNLICNVANPSRRAPHHSPASQRSC